MLIRLVYLIFMLAVSVLALSFARSAGYTALEISIFQLIGPVQLSVAGPVQSITGASGALQSVAELREENQRLRTEVERLSMENARLLYLEGEVEQLQARVGLREARPDYQWIGAKIVAFDSGDLVQSIVLDRGSMHGLEVGMTVMTPRGLVGQIIRVSSTVSKALMINDVGSSTNGIVLNSRARGIVVGSRTGRLIMKFVPQGHEIRPGDRVVTSGLGGVFPEGIIIGRVIGVRQRDIDMFQEATIEPAVEFDRLESVLVVTNHLPIRLD